MATIPNTITERVALLRSDVTAWNALDLRGANLRGADLSGASLCGADLGGANLRGANLGGVDPLVVLRALGCIVD